MVTTPPSVYTFDVGKSIILEASTEVYPYTPVAIILFNGVVILFPPFNNPKLLFTERKFAYKDAIINV